MDGRTDFPELVFLLRQIRNFRGTGAAAQMYYEGKVSEAISLIIEKTKKDLFPVKIKNPSVQDLDRLASVSAYINDHFAANIHLNQLARIACMGTTKLKYMFKEVYQCTITEYIQHKRMSQAEQLLVGTDLSINQIAQIVGYIHAGRFSKLFQRNTGLLPHEYRKLAASIH